MRRETIGKVCELCDTPDDLQVHHISYDPEITQILCVPCHRKQHNGHGVGESTNSAMFRRLMPEFIDIHDVVLNRRCIALALGISESTAYEWDKKLGMIKYTAKDRRNYECLQRINVTVSAKAKKVLTTYQKEHGLNNLDSALESFLIEHGGQDAQ